MNETEKLIKACANIIIDAIIECIYTDPHQWSSRPCITCKTISSLINKPFGCDRYRKEYADRHRNIKK